MLKRNPNLRFAIDIAACLSLSLIASIALQAGAKSMLRHLDPTAIDRGPVTCDR